MQKECYRCKQTKPLAGFEKNHRMKDGHINLCKSCRNKDRAGRRARNIEAYRRWDRLEGMSPARQEAQRRRHRSESKKKTNQAARAKWNAANPEKYAAQQAIASAIRYGHVIRQPCFICGKPNAQAHHADYSRPLQVTWLCAKHHIETHCQARLLDAGTPAASAVN